MKFLHRFYRHLPWFNLPVAALVALLQRTPVLRIATQAETALVGSPVGQVLRSAFTAVASLGAVHALAGATQFVLNPAATAVSGTVGSTLSPSIAFSVVGAVTPAGSYRISGLPPGLSVPGATNGVINAQAGVISGTPTTAGTYTTTILAYERNNAAGDSFGPARITFTITALTAPPAFSLQPLSQSVPTGGTVTFTSSATGTPTPTYQWRKDGVALSGATGASLTLTNVQPAQGGAYTVVAQNSVTSTTSSVATLTVTGVPVQPEIVAQPVPSLALVTGQSLALSVSATGGGLSYQWRRGSTAISGATSSTFTIKSVAAADAGSYLCTVSNTVGSRDSATAAVTVAASTANPGRLINLSVLTGLDTAGESFVMGYVVSGATVANPKPLVIRAGGPSLTPFGVSPVLADPKLEVFAGTTKAGENEDWGGGATMVNAMTAVGAFGFAPATSRDAAFLANATSRDNSVKISAGATAPNGTGGVIGEVYDATPSTSFNAATTPRLVNLSVNKNVGSGLTMGFVIGGATAKTMLVRAVGPTLANFGVGGVMADPKVELIDAVSQKSLATNDNWGGLAALSTAFTDTGAFDLPAGSADAALLITLPPGNYTAVVSVASGATGVALVEVYEVP